jgi:hypothetical protein
MVHVELPDCLSDFYYVECLTPIINRLCHETAFTESQLSELTGKFFERICEVGKQNVYLMPKVEDFFDKIGTE